MGDGENTEGRIPTWLKWVLAILGLLLLLYFFSPYLVSLLGFGGWIVGALIGILLILYLLYKLIQWLRRRRSETSNSSRQQRDNQRRNEIRKVEINVIPDRRGRPYPQGTGQQIRLSPHVEGGSNNLRFEWRVSDYRLTNETEEEQQIEVDRFRFSGSTLKVKIRLWVTDIDSGQTVSAKSSIVIGQGAPTTTDIRIVKPWKSSKGETRNVGDSLVLVAELSEPRAANEIFWGIVSGAIRRDLQAQIGSATTIGMATINGHSTSPLTYTVTGTP